MVSVAVLVFLVLFRVGVGLGLKQLSEETVWSRGADGRRQFGGSATRPKANIAISSAAKNA
jgi:hypothetical protein